jgi:hypothetical protein
VWLDNCSIESHSVHTDKTENNKKWIIFGRGKKIVSFFYRGTAAVETKEDLIYVL